MFQVSYSEQLIFQNIRPNYIKTISNVCMINEHILTREKIMKYVKLFTILVMHLPFWHQKEPHFYEAVDAFQRFYVRR